MVGRAGDVPATLGTAIRAVVTAGPAVWGVRGHEVTGSQWVCRVGRGRGRGGKRQAHGLDMQTQRLEGYSSSLNCQALPGFVGRGIA